MVYNPLEQAARAAADRWAEFLNQPGGTGSIRINEFHARQRSPIPPNEVERIAAELYAYITEWFSEREGYQQMILDHDYHMNEHLLAAIGCLVNPRDLPLKTWVRISRDECGHYRVSSSCGYMTDVTKQEFRHSSGGGVGVKVMIDSLQLTGDDQVIAHKLINEGVVFLGVDDDWPGGCDVSQIVECGDWFVGIRDSGTGFEVCCENHVFAYELNDWLSDMDLIKGRSKLVSLIEDVYWSGR